MTDDRMADSASANSQPEPDRLAQQVDRLQKFLSDVSTGAIPASQLEDLISSLESLPLEPENAATSADNGSTTPAAEAMEELTMPRDLPLGYPPEAKPPEIDSAFRGSHTKVLLERYAEKDIDAKKHVPRRREDQQELDRHLELLRRNPNDIKDHEKALRWLAELAQMTYPGTNQHPGNVLSPAQQEEVFAIYESIRGNKPFGEYGTNMFTQLWYGIAPRNADGIVISCMLEDIEEAGYTTFGVRSELMERATPLVVANEKEIAGSLRGTIPM